MIDPNTPYCKHCGERIRWSESYGWIHGELGGSWNTSCDDDENRAAVNDEWWAG